MKHTNPDISQVNLCLCVLIVYEILSYMYMHYDTSFWKFDINPCPVESGFTLLLQTV